MGALTAWAETVTAALIGEGLSATADPRNLNPPGALVVIREVEPHTSCTVKVSADVLLIAPGPGNADAGGWLSDQLPAVWRALGHRPRATLIVWINPHTGKQNLAYQFDHTDHVAI